MGSRDQRPDRYTRGNPSQRNDNYHDGRNSDRFRGDFQPRGRDERDRDYPRDRLQDNYSRDRRRQDYQSRQHNRSGRYYDRDTERNFDSRRSRSYSRSRSRSRSRSPRRYRSRTPPRRYNEERDWQQTYTVSARNASLATVQTEAHKSEETPKDTLAKDPGMSTKTKKRKAEAQKEKDKEKEEPGNARLQAQFGLWQTASAQVHGVKEQLNTQDGPVKKKVKLSFADAIKMRCLLCRRQFLDTEKLRKHERKSQLHHSNLLDKGKRRAGYESMIKHGIIAPNRRPVDTSTYIDRAKERRQFHSQPSRPPQHQTQKTTKATSQSSKDEEDSAVKSRGASMMSKMGWAQGQGLGVDGIGRDSVVETSLYAQGIGLGASGGKLGDAIEEANRSTTSDYNSKGWDKTRERFEALKR